MTVACDGLGAPVLSIVVKITNGDVASIKVLAKSPRNDLIAVGGQVPEVPVGLIKWNVDVEFHLIGF